MGYERRHRWGWWLLLTLLLVVLAIGCTRVGVENVSDKSGVNIHLDWGGGEVPSGMKFYFYPVEGEPAETVQAKTPATGYQGELSVACYQVLAYNTDVARVTFSGMENYGTATVSAASLPTRVGGVTLIAQPSLLYAGTLGELKVPRLTSVETVVVPRLLTKTLKLKFDIEQLPEVHTLKGELRGLFSSVLLSTGEATELSREQAPRVGTVFETPVISGNTTVSVRYFGILNPEEGERYKNEMPITLKDGDGWEQTTMVDLTQVLTDIASQYPWGGFEFEFEDEIKINVEPTPTGLFAYVLSWTRYGEGEGEISYIIY